MSKGAAAVTQYLDSHPEPDADDLALGLLADRVDAALRGHDIPRSDLELVIGETLFQAARLVRMGAAVDLPDLGILRRRAVPGRPARIKFEPHECLLREWLDVA